MAGEGGGGGGGGSADAEAAPGPPALRRGRRVLPELSRSRGVGQPKRVREARPGRDRKHGASGQVLGSVSWLLSHYCYSSTGHLGKLIVNTLPAQKSVLSLNKNLEWV